jgi:hypothetical protein
MGIKKSVAVLVGGGCDDLNLKTTTKKACT